MADAGSFQRRGTYYGGDAACWTPSMSPIRKSSVKIASDACSGKAERSKSASSKKGSAPKAAATAAATCTGTDNKAAARKNSAAKMAPGKLIHQGPARGLCVPAQGFRTRCQRSRRAPVRFGVHEHVEGLSLYKLVDKPNNKTGRKVVKTWLGPGPYQGKACSGGAAETAKPCDGGKVAPACNGGKAAPLACNGGQNAGCG